MALSEVSLSASARSNLLALKNTAKLLDATQTKLSSGKKVNSALDNATSFFASQGFLNSANDLDGLKDSMSTALQTIKAATDAIDSITTIVAQMQAIVGSAVQTTDDTVRANYAAQYNALKSQLDDLANDATFNGTNLVNNITSSLRVIFNADNTTGLSVSGQDLRSDGMGVNGAVGSFAVGTLASQTTQALSVDSTGNTLTSATYSGAITFSGTSAVNPGAETAMNATNQLTIHSGGYTNGTIVSAIDAAVATTGLTAIGANDGGATYAGIQVTGTYSVSANDASASVYTDATGAVAAGGVGVFTVTIAAGDTVKLATAAGTQEYINNGSSAVSISIDTTAASTIASGTNSTTTYIAAGGTAVASDFNIAVGSGSTLNGNNLVDSGTLGIGSPVTVVTTQEAASGASEGTTNNGTVTAYDTGSSTVSGVADAGTVTATKVGIGAYTGATYTTVGATITVANVKSLSGSSTTVVADSITTAQNQLKDALATLRSAAASLGNNNTLVQTRLDFTNNLINTLSVASDNLVLADTNEEGANLQALQAQSQLGIVALGISGQQAQAVLRLF